MEGISKEKLEAWIQEAGWEKLINKKSTTWRNLEESVRESIGNESQAIALMKEHTSLIKRPVVEVNGKIKFIGFDEASFNSLSK